MWNLSLCNFLIKIIHKLAVRWLELGSMQFLLDKPLQCQGCKCETKIVNVLMVYWAVCFKIP